MRQLALIVSLLPVIAFAVPKKPSPTPTPGPNGEVPKGTMVCLPKQKWLELVDWFNGLHNENTKAQTDLAAALKSNAQTQSNLNQANTDLANLKKEMAEGQQCVSHPFSFWFHRLLKHIFILAGILIVAGVLLSIFLPGASAFFVFIWKWILALFSPKPKV